MGDNTNNPDEHQLPHGLTKGDIAKFGVLVAIIGGSIALTIFLWPYIKQLSSQEGMQELITTVRSTGPLAVGVLLVLQFAQVIIAFIPGEVVQVIAGILYGPVWGTLIILGGALGSTVIIYHLVQKLGTPFVSKMVPDETQEKLGFITRTSRIDAIVFVLFLIPGLPKDLITYLVALTDVRKSRFFLFSTLGRAPGVIVTSFAGHSLAGGNWVTLAIIVGIAVVILVIFFLLRDKVMAFFNKFADKHSLHHGDHKPEGEDETEPVEEGVDAGAEAAAEDAGEEHVAEAKREDEN